MALWGKSIYKRGIVYLLALFSLAIQTEEINGQVVSVNSDGNSMVNIVKSNHSANFHKLGITSYLLNEESYKTIQKRSQQLRFKLTNNVKPKFKLTVGDSREFFVRNVITGDTWNTLEAVLSYQNEGINIWIQKTAYDTLYGKPAFDSIVQGFNEFLYHSTSEYSINPDKGVLELLHQYVGEFPDVDGDQVLDVLLLDIVDNFEETGSYVAGFFDPVNLYEHAYSNQSDLIYLDLYPTILLDGQVDVESAVSTFVHESQHLIHAGYEGEETELVFINEGFSEAAEIICGFEPRSPASFQQNPIKSLITWDHNNPLSDYSRASLWMHYLLEQLGSESLKYFVQNPRIGIKGYKEVIESISSLTFEEIFQNWGLALTINDADRNPKYGYQHELRKQSILKPQTVVKNLPISFNEELPDFINIPVSFSLTKELKFNTGLPSMSNIRVSSVSSYPGNDEIEIQNNSHSGLNAKADKWNFGEIEVLISKFGDADSTNNSVLSFMGDGEKSGRELSWGYGKGSPEQFYMNASYLMLNGKHEKIGIILPPVESAYWLKNFKLWTLFKSELEGGGIDGDEKRDFEMSIYTLSNGKPDREILPPDVFEVQRGLGKLLEEEFDLSDFYEKFSAIEDTLIMIFGNDADDENYLALGMSKGDVNASFYSENENLNSGWASLSEKSIGGTLLENWNPVLKVGKVIPKVEQYSDPSIREIVYNFEQVRVKISPNNEYDSSSVFIVGELPDGSFTSGTFISKNQNQFTFSFPVLVDGPYKFTANYSSPDEKIDYRDEKIWNIEVPNGFEMSNNYPNPFNPSTNVPFLLLEQAEVSWEVFDVTGKLVLEIPVRTFLSGEHQQKIDLSGYASGMYIIRAKLYRERSNVTNFKTQKVMLIK